MMRKMVQLDLFSITKNEKLACFTLAKRLDKSMTSNQHFRDIIAQIKESHDYLSNSHDPVMINPDLVMQEEKRREERRVEENRVEDRREKSIAPQPKRFTPPTLEEVQSRITEMNYSIDAERFMSHYQSNGWMVGRNKMKDWKASLVTWSKSDNKPKQTYQPKQSKTDVSMQTYERVQEMKRQQANHNNFIDGEIA